MSDSSSSGKRPLIPGQVAVWLGVVAFVAAGLIVTGYSYLALRQAPNQDALRRQAQKDLRAENAKKAQALLTQVGGTHVMLTLSHIESHAMAVAALVKQA